MYKSKAHIRGVRSILRHPMWLTQTKRIRLDSVVSIEIDGYSNEYKTMVEVFARIGKLAPAHYKKLANDILKLKLAEDILNVPHKKYIAVCGEEAERYPLGNSWKTFAAKHYDLEIAELTSQWMIEV